MIELTFLEEFKLRSEFSKLGASLGFSNQNLLDFINDQLRDWKRSKAVEMGLPVEPVKLRPWEWQCDKEQDDDDVDG